MRIFLLLCAVCLLAVGCAKDSTPTTTPTLKEGKNVGDLAPNFTLPDKDNNEIRLKNYRGKVVVLEFWSSNCSVCQSEMKDMEMVWNQFRDSDKFAMIGVSLDSFEKAWRDYISSTETGSGYPRDWVQVWNRLKDVASNSYGVEGTPSRFLIDKDGVIIDANLTVEEMGAKVAAELAK